MVCAISALSTLESPLGDVESHIYPDPRSGWFFGDRRTNNVLVPRFGAGETADASDPFDDFEDDDFDDEFDDDFEEDWEDDLTEDDEFPDTFGGADEPDEVEEPAE